MGLFNFVINYTQSHKVCFINLPVNQNTEFAAFPVSVRSHLLRKFIGLCSAYKLSLFMFFNTMCK